MKSRKNKPSNVALKVEHISKSFRLPTEQASGIKQAFINRMRGIKGYTEQHVLKDISFEVEKGDFFGIVGRNGSGKSTLLHLLGLLDRPTSGEYFFEKNIMAGEDWSVNRAWQITVGIASAVDHAEDGECHNDNEKFCHFK